MSYNYLYSPITGRLVSLKDREGIFLLKNYVRAFLRNENKQTGGILIPGLTLNIGQINTEIPDSYVDIEKAKVLESIKAHSVFNDSLFQKLRPEIQTRLDSAARGDSGTTATYFHFRFWFKEYFVKIMSCQSHGKSLLRELYNGKYLSEKVAQIDRKNFSLLKCSGVIEEDEDNGSPTKVALVFKKVNGSILSKESLFSKGETNSKTVRPENEIKQFWLKLAKSLKILQDLDFYHNDINLGNIMVVQDSSGIRPVIIDFGEGEICSIHKDCCYEEPHATEIKCVGSPVDLIAKKLVPSGYQVGERYVEKFYNPLYVEYFRGMEIQMKKKLFMQFCSIYMYLHSIKQPGDIWKLKFGFLYENVLQNDSFLFYECSKASAPKNAANEQTDEPTFSLLDTAIKAIQDAAPAKFKAIQDAKTHEFLPKEDVTLGTQQPPVHEST